MRIPLLVAACTAALAAGHSAMVAAPAQPTQTTQQPGQMTEARVTVQNHGRGQAVPISLQEIAVDTPLRVRVVNGQLSPGADEPVNVRVVRPPAWQYQTVEVPADVNLATALTAAGAAGWETTGITSTRAGAMTVLLKRQRQAG
jgi:hypothetical protein